MTYIKTTENLQNDLKEQLELLDNSIKSYDEGSYAEAKNMAARLRLLLHDTRNSKSLLGSMNLLETTDFLDTYIVKNPISIPMSHYGLTIIDPSFKHPIPLLDEDPSHDGIKKANFNDWWNAVVINDSSGQGLTRKDLVLNVADQDGGAHIDTELTDEVYLNMKYFNSLGLMFGNNTTEKAYFVDVIAGSIRQIAHEVRKTLEPGYVCPTANIYKNSSGFQIADMCLSVEPIQTTVRNKTKIGRNSPCPCGSGLKYKKCCLGKPSSILAL